MRNEVLGRRSLTTTVVTRMALAYALVITSACEPAAVPAPPVVAIAPIAATPELRETDSSESRAKPEAEAPPIAWETSEPDARDRSKRRSQPLLVYLRADWSAASLREERDVWTDPRVAAEARRFVALRIDLSSTAGDADGYLSRYGIDVVPTTVVFDGSGRRVAALAGEIDVAPLLAVLASVD